MKDQVPPELEVWALWRALKRIFPVWSLLPSAFWTPGAWGYVGLDHVTGLRRNATTRATFALLQDRSDEALATLTALASLNSRRQGQMFSIVAIIYITVPLTLVATWAQIAPGGVERYIRGHLLGSVQVLVAATLAAGYYFLSHWRSRQVVEVLELVRIERAGDR